jgi:hypothetical protein
MVTLTYTPALEQDRKVALVAPYNVAREGDNAQILLAILSPPAEERDRAMPLYCRGAAIPQLVVICGCGFQQVSGAALPDGSYEVVTKEYVPTYSGIAVEQDFLYGFSVWLKLLSAGPTTAGIMWFDSPGKVANQLGVIESDPWTPDRDTWELFTVQGIPPEEATYLVPYVRLTNTFMDIPFYVAGAMVYIHGEAGTVTAFAPDRYLTLGDPGEKLGESGVSGGGFVIGAPAER